MFDNEKQIFKINKKLPLISTIDQELELKKQIQFTVSVLTEEELLLIDKLPVIFLQKFINFKEKALSITSEFQHHIQHILNMFEFDQ